MKKLLFFIFAVLAFVSTVFAQTTEPDYLCFEVEAGTKIKLICAIGSSNINYKSVNVQYSYDKIKWYGLGQSAITIANDCFIYFRGKNEAFYDPNLGNIYQPSSRAGFSVSKPFKCSGNIMTLIDQTGTTTLSDWAFCNLFYGCPMITAPKLPAVKLAYRCYQGMFSYCTELIAAPELPATELARSCYQSMFYNCTKLEKAPDLPATTLSMNCYESMFTGCTNLEIAPRLPAIIVSNGNYGRMFNGCNKLNHMSVDFREWSINGEYTEDWVKNIAPTGTFICPKELEQKFGDSWIPNGWTIKYIEDLYNITIPESLKDYITISKTTEIDAGSEITFSVIDRTSEGYVATVTVNGTNEIETIKSGNDYSFTMPEEDVTISVTYAPIKYTITTDDYSSVEETEVSAGETVNVNFSQRDGYTLSSAKFNNTALTINNNAAKFTMPAGNVSITATYTPIEYTITSDQYSTPNKTKANVGDEITVTFSQRDGYTLSSAKFNNTALTISNNAATFTMPAKMFQSLRLTRRLNTPSHLTNILRQAKQKQILAKKLR